MMMMTRESYGNCFIPHGLVPIITLYTTAHRWNFKLGVAMLAVITFGILPHISPLFLSLLLQARIGIHFFRLWWN